MDKETRQHFKKQAVENGTPIEFADFSDVKEGDTVIRLMAEQVRREMKVDKVDAELIYVYCTGPEDAWTFHRETGIEVDEELGWGPQFGMTGSRLIRE